jgi:hypothetical protein
MLTHTRIRYLFNYSPTGHLVRRIGVKGSEAGTTIGTMKPKGYIVAVVDGKMYRVHHLVWFWHHRSWAVELDHENRVRHDNRIENLRLCTHTQNLGNMRPRVHKYKGVTFCKQTGKWRAQITINYRATHLGRFVTMEEAAQAYNQAAREHFGEFAHLNEIP